MHNPGYRKNFENHGFFVVESFPMPWAQARAIPHGMAYRLADREWPEWMPEIIESDLEYWKDLVHSLMSDSSFRKYEEAGRAFSKLRANLGDLYRIREHVEEAETAYRQALQLWPVNLLAVNELARILVSSRRVAEARDLVEKTLEMDPHNRLLKELLQELDSEPLSQAGQVR